MSKKPMKEGRGQKPDTSKPNTFKPEFYNSDGVNYETVNEAYRAQDTFTTLYGIYPEPQESPWRPYIPPSTSPWVKRIYETISESETPPTKPAVCPHCNCGLRSASIDICPWCGKVLNGWECPVCGELVSSSVTCCDHEGTEFELPEYDEDE